MEEIQYSMIEPPDGGQTWPSGLWDVIEVSGYLTQRQNRFLKDTHLQVGIADIPGQVGNSRYDLPTDWIATVRVVWVPDAGSIRPLGRADMFQADHGYPTWGYIDGTPSLYTDADVPTLTLQIAPAPNAPGKFQIMYVPMAPALDGSGDCLTIQPEFHAALKYGVMADMLTKTSQANDPSRAQYCEDRFQLGMEIAEMLLNGFTK